MPAFRALYYPSWNPPVQWFRSALLLFDQIQVICPAEVDNPNYDVANQRVCDSPGLSDSGGAFVLRR